MLKNFDELKKKVEEINEQRKRSKWARGVGEYALELLENIQAYDEEPTNTQEVTAQLLGGADDWSMYSYGGCSLIYDWDICERLATPSEQKRTKFGELKPNAREEWLDTQARALSQAARRVVIAFHNLRREK